MGYLGSKAASGAYQAIISQMPPHDTYIETHLGGGAVLLNKPPAALSVAIDIDCITASDFLDENAAFVAKQSDSLQVRVEDAITELVRFPFSTAGRVLIYADPPYLAATRTGRARYRHEYNDDDHVKLINVLRNVPASVMISGYPSALYDELLFDWRSIEFQVMTRGGPRTEKLWMNFPREAAYSHAFAGEDYIERQRIKRKAERWRKNYLSCPPGERLAILSELLRGE